MSVSQPELVCQTMGLALAEITSDEETTALQEITSKCAVLNQPCRKIWQSLLIGQRME